VDPTGVDGVLLDDGVALDELGCPLGGSTPDAP
jgi:hypothetical protein